MEWDRRAQFFYKENLYPNSMSAALICFFHFNNLKSSHLRLWIPKDVSPRLSYRISWLEVNKPNLHAMLFNAAVHTSTDSSYDAVVSLFLLHNEEGMTLSAILSNPNSSTNPPNTPNPHNKKRTFSIFSHFHWLLFSAFRLVIQCMNSCEIHNHKLSPLTFVAFFWELFCRSLLH